MDNIGLRAIVCFNGNGTFADAQAGLKSKDKLARNVTDAWSLEFDHFR